VDCLRRESGEYPFGDNDRSCASPQIRVVMNPNQKGTWLIRNDDYVASEYYLPVASAKWKSAWI
jgi:hypothetical protein